MGCHTVSFKAPKDEGLCSSLSFEIFPDEIVIMQLPTGRKKIQGFQLSLPSVCNPPLFPLCFFYFPTLWKKLCDGEKKEQLQCLLTGGTRKHLSKSSQRFSILAFIWFSIHLMNSRNTHKVRQSLIQSLLPSYTFRNVSDGEWGWSVTYYLMPCHYPAHAVLGGVYIRKTSLLVYTP